MGDQMTIRERAQAIEGAEHLVTVLSRMAAWLAGRGVSGLFICA